MPELLNKLSRSHSRRSASLLSRGRGIPPFAPPVGDAARASHVLGRCQVLDGIHDKGKGEAPTLPATPLLSYSNRYVLRSKDRAARLLLDVASANAVVQNLSFEDGGMVMSPIVEATVKDVDDASNTLSAIAAELEKIATSVYVATSKDVDDDSDMSSAIAAKLEKIANSVYVATTKDVEYEKNEDKSSADDDDASNTLSAMFVELEKIATSGSIVLPEPNVATVVAESTATPTPGSNDVLDAATYKAIMIRDGCKAGCTIPAVLMAPPVVNLVADSAIFLCAASTLY